MFTSKIITWVLIMLGFSLCSFTIYKVTFGRDELTLELLMGSLTEAHYKPQTLDDKFSEDFFELYTKRLDYNKKFLTQGDIDQLAKYKKQIDDEIKATKFEMFELSYSLISKGIESKEALYKEILSKPFDYNKEEFYESDAEKVKFAKTEDELKDEWRKWLKYQTVARLSSMMDDQDKIKAAKDTTAKVLPFDTLELQARKKVLKSNDDWFKRLKKVTKRDRLANYINTITAMYDPHTEFFMPKEKKKFDQSMSGQMEGIGARLQSKDGYLKISEIVVGSASWRQGELKAGDIILKVAQGAGEPVDVVDMDIDDAIELIKGKKGTEVRLTVKKADGSTTVIPIIRDVVELKETYAHSAIINNNKQKIGFIKLPSFYTDFTKTGAHHCSEDIKKEIEKLKAEGVDGIVLDLRDNGGGSLQEVVKMGGLFITKGPIVQVRERNGRSKHLDDYNENVTYDGPLVVMVNHGSASASEILAAAIQDYKRGVIVGTQSFGKGTVQSFVDLDNLTVAPFDTAKSLGSVKITMQKFYRINGSTTQLKGVVPDIALADPYSMLDVGEKELDNPLAFDEMEKAAYVEFKNLDYAKLLKNSQARMKKSKAFGLVEEEAKELKRKKDDTKYNLSLAKYRAEVKEIREENKKYDDLKKDLKDFDANLVKADVEALANDTTELSKNKKWAEALKKDFYLQEAANIIGDMK